MLKKSKKKKIKDMKEKKKVRLFKESFALSIYGFSSNSEKRFYFKIYIFYFTSKTCFTSTLQKAEQSEVKLDWQRLKRLCM